jgi:hypothetical protein
VALQVVGVGVGIREQVVQPGDKVLTRRHERWGNAHHRLKRADFRVGVGCDVVKGVGVFDVDAHVHTGGQGLAEELPQRGDGVIEQRLAECVVGDGALDDHLLKHGTRQDFGQAVIRGRR